MTGFRRTLETLEQALDTIEQVLARRAPDDDELEQFKVTVDAVRTDALSIIAATHSGNHHEFARKFRLRRAAQICQNVLFGIEEGSITGNTPGLDDLRSTVAETLDQLFAQQSSRPSKGS